MPHFRFKLIPFIATVLLVILGCSLAYWQTQRAKQKEQIEAQLQLRENTPVIDLPTEVDLAKMEYMRVRLTGEFIQEWPLYLENRPMNGMPGMDVVMPFKLKGQSTYVLVLRGWIPRNSLDRRTIKSYQTPSGVIQIDGMLKANSGRVLQLGQRDALRPGALIQNLDTAMFAQASQLTTANYFVEQISDLSDGLSRNWPRASMGSERHRGYAFQWLALAGLTLLFFLVSSFVNNSVVPENETDHKVTPSN